MEKKCDTCRWEENGETKNYICSLCIVDCRSKDPIPTRWEPKKYLAPGASPNQTRMNTITALEIVLTDKLTLAKQKNSDYGDSFAQLMNKLQETGINPYVGLYIRIMDKVSRFENLAIKGSKQRVSDESIDDTLRDLSTYIDLFMAWKRSNDNGAV